MAVNFFHNRFEVWLLPYLPHNRSSRKVSLVTDKGKWIFHSLPFGINIGPSVFSHVLDKVLAQFTEFALNYLDDIMIFSKMWQDHFSYLEEVFKCLQDADLKIKQLSAHFFKSQVYYLGFLVGTQECNHYQKRSQL